MVVSQHATNVICDNDLCDDAFDSFIPSIQLYLILDLLAWMINTRLYGYYTLGDKGCVIPVFLEWSQLNHFCWFQWRSAMMGLILCLWVQRIAGCWGNELWSSVLNLFEHLFMILPKQGAINDLWIVHLTKYQLRFIYCISFLCLSDFIINYDRTRYQ